MRVIIPLFVISSIIMICYFKQTKKLITNKVYLFSVLLLLFILPFGLKTDNGIDIIKIILSDNIFDFLNITLYNVDYIFSYIFVITVITLIQVCISIFFLEKKIREIKINNNNNKEYKKTEEVKEFSVDKVENKLSLDKVFIDYCRMMN